MVLQDTCEYDRSSCALLRFGILFVWTVREKLAPKTSGHLRTTFFSGIWGQKRCDIYNPIWNEIDFGIIQTLNFLHTIFQATVWLLYSRNAQGCLSPLVKPVVYLRIIELKGVIQQAISKLENNDPLDAKKILCNILSTEFFTKKEFKQTTGLEKTPDFDTIRLQNM